MTSSLPSEDAVCFTLLPTTSSSCFCLPVPLSKLQPNPQHKLFQAKLKTTTKPCTSATFYIVEATELLSLHHNIPYHHWNLAGYKKTQCRSYKNNQSKTRRHKARGQAFQPPLGKILLIYLGFCFYATSTLLAFLIWRCVGVFSHRRQIWRLSKVMATTSALPSIA